MLVCCAGCAATHAAAYWPRASIPDHAPPPQGELLLDDIEVELQPGHNGAPVALVTKHRVFRAGTSKAPPFVAPYDSTFEQLVSFRARSIAPNGVERRFDRASTTDAPLFPTFEMYSDRRALKLDFPNVVPGTILEVESTIRATLPTLLSLSQVFGGATAVDEARFVVHAPLGWEIDWLAQGRDAKVQFEPVVTSDAKGRTWRWVQRDLAAIPREPRAPPSTIRGTRVFARLRTWREGTVEKHAPADPTALSAAEFALADPAPTTPVLTALARKLTEGESTDEGRVRKVYSWVRDRVAYCAVEVGLGGFKPHPADDVASLRYGDCKDKANLVRALLDSLGIESRLVVIWAHDGVPHLFALPTIDNFNHAIIQVRVGGSWVLADPTSRVAPFGSLPAADEGATVLPLTREGSPLAVAPMRAPDESHIFSTLDVRLEGTSLEGTVRVEASGEYADLVRGHLLEHADPLAVADRLAGVRGKLARVELEHGAPPEQAAPVAVKASVQIDWRAAATHTFLRRVSELLGTVAITLPEAKRTQPLLVGPRGIRRETLSIELPVGTTVETLPEPIRLDAGVGTFGLRFERRDRAIVVTRDLALRESVVPADDYAAARGFFESIRRAEATPLVFHRTTP